MRPRRKDWAKLKADDVGGTLAESVDAFNSHESELTVSELIPLDAQAVNKWAAETGGLLDIESGMNTGSSESRARCRAALDNFNNSSILYLDLSDPAVMAMLNAMVVDSVLVTEKMEKLVAAAAVKKSWAEVNWPRDVIDTEIEHVRAL